MNIKKGRFKGINGLPADYYWFSINGKKDRKQGIQEMELWLAKVTPTLDHIEKLIIASNFDVMVYKYLTKPKKWWLRFNTDQKIKIIAMTIGSVIAITFGTLKLMIAISP